MLLKNKLFNLFLNNNFIISQYLLNLHIKIKKLATTYFLSRVTHKYLRHIRAWLLCSVWEQVFPLCYHHQKCFVCFFLAHSKIYRIIVQLNLLHIYILWLSPRFISIGQLNTLLHLHLQPIYHVVFMESYYLTIWDILS